MKSRYIKVSTSHRNSGCIPCPSTIFGGLRGELSKLNPVKLLNGGRFSASCSVGFKIVLATVLIFCASPALAAAEDEIVVLQATLGHDIPMPSMEMGHGFDYMQLLYDPLVGTTPDGALSTEHGLARKWEMSPDAKTWTFYLRKGVKFHDGSEVTAKDAKFSIEQLQQKGARATNASLIRDRVESVDVKDPYTLVVNCKGPFLFLPSVLSDQGAPDGGVIPKDYFEKVGEEKFTNHPIGSGPYKFHSRSIGSFIKLEAAGKHWLEGIPKYKYMTFKQISEESTRLAMLKTGEADMTRVSRAKLDELRQAGLNILSKKDHAYMYVFPNMQWATPAFSDINFRKALNLAIDKEAIIKYIFAGSGRLTTSYPGNAILAAGGDPTLKPYPYDPEEAKRLIKEGGYSGYEFNLASYPRSGAPEFPRMIEAIAGYWEKAGLKPKIQKTEYAPFREKANARKVQNWVCGFDSAASSEVSAVLRRLRLKYYSKVKRTATIDPNLDAMLDKAETSLDINEIRKIIGDIHRYDYNNYLVVPICNINDELAVAKRLPQWDLGTRREGRNLRGLIKN